MRDRIFVILTQGWDGMPIAFHALKEGARVVVGQVQDKSELNIGDDSEKEDEKEMRLRQYDGMLEKYPADELVRSLIMEGAPEKYFIFCDQNNLWHYAEQLAAAGFTMGNFPRKEDWQMEKERDEAMAFVKANYPDVQIIPFQEFKAVDECIEFLKTADRPYVLQSNGDFVSTVVPTKDDPEAATGQLIAQLEKNRQNYEKGGIILKEKLVNPIELTPEMMFFDGEPVFTDLDIETKTIGDGENNGNQSGCGTNLVVATEFMDEINRIAFPEVVLKRAKERKGIFIWDISLYVLPEADEYGHQGIYFGEFCPNRFGYDAFMTECSMAGGVLDFFEAVTQKQNPLGYRFGAAVRLFNLNKADGGAIAYTDDVADQIYLYEVSEGENGMASIGNCWDLGVIVGHGDTIKEAVAMAYEGLEGFSFKEVYTRTERDFLEDYPTSIIHRFNATVGKYFEGEIFKTLSMEFGAFKEMVKNKLYGHIENH